jgi:hypothetical protein
MLLGHDIALKGSYFKPTEKDLLEGNGKMLGYLAAIDALTISEENRLRHEVVELKAELTAAAPKDMVEYLSKENQSLKLQMEKIQQEQDAKFERIMSWIQHNPAVALVKPEVLLEKCV